jgi:hypothetical protein
MAVPLFGFTWGRPVGGQGYVLEQSVCPFPRNRDACHDSYEAAEWSPAKIKAQKAEPVLVPAPGADPDPYDPLREETGLFRTFADTEPTPEGCLAFANRYGCLQVGMFGRDDGVSQPVLIERVQAWRMRIVWLRHLLQLWERARAGDAQSLSRYVKWDGNTLVFCNLPPERPVIGYGDYFGCEDRRGNTVTFDPDVLYPDLQDFLEPGSLIKPALFFCQTAITGELHDAIYAPVAGVALVWDRAKGGPSVQIMPHNLWAAILLQFALAIDGNRDYQRCPGCGTWFELSPGTNRSDRLTCSDSCRVRLVRQRREQAGQLHAQGKSPRQIAKETGAKIENVKRWIQELRSQQQRKG